MTGISRWEHDGEAGVKVRGTALRREHHSSFHLSPPGGRTAVTLQYVNGEDSRGGNTAPESNTEAGAFRFSFPGFFSALYHYLLMTCTVK